MQTSERALTRTRPRTTGVLEVDPTGHRLQYVRHLLEATGADRCVVFVREWVRSGEVYATHHDSAIVYTVAVAGEDDRSRALDEAVARSPEIYLASLVIIEGHDYLLPLLHMLLRRPRQNLRFRLVPIRTPSLGGPGAITPAVLSKPVVAQLRLFPQARIHFLADAVGVGTSRRGWGVAAVRDPVAAAGPGGPTLRPPDPRGPTSTCPRGCRREPRAVIDVGGRVGPEAAAYLVPSGAWLARATDATKIGRSTSLTPPAVAPARRDVHQDIDVCGEATRRACTRVVIADSTTTTLLS